MREERLQAVYAHFARFIADGELAGGAIAAAIGGEQVVEWYGGEAAPGLKAGPGVLWPLASISKSYTAATVLALVERGDLTLSTRVAEVLPGFGATDGADGRERITLRHLLSHTSGLIYESPEMEARLITQTPLDALYDEAPSYPLLFAPGTAYSYSDYGYGLAGRIAATVTGRPFPELVRELVLEPAGLTDTFMPPSPQEAGRLAHVAASLAYGTPGAMYNSPYAIALAHPSFGTVASVNDLLRFGLLFAPGGPRIHAAATVRAMTTDQTGGRALGPLPSDPEGPAEPIAWGYGFGIVTAHPAAVLCDLAPPGSFGHGGASGCNLLIDPVDGITIAIVSNNHLRSGPARWLRRLTTISNGLLAALTTPEG
jgi:CubicO group peptidase (beta-lactamase class C family)